MEGGEENVSQLLKALPFPVPQKFIVLSRFTLTAIRRVSVVISTFTTQVSYNSLHFELQAN